MQRWALLVTLLTVARPGGLIAQDALPPLRTRTVYAPRPPAFRPACDSVAATSAVYDTVRLATATAQPPRLVRVPNMAAPPGLVGVRARVDLRFVIDTAGQLAPCSVEVVRASDPRFVPAAVRTLEGMVFLPGRDGGRPVSTVAMQPIIWEGL